MGLTGAVNSAPFRGFQAGEVLFMGASGTRRGVDVDDRWEITYKFAASPNQSGMSVGSISSIQKRGWDYLWVRYEKQEKGSGADKVVVMYPVNVTVDQVYDYNNLAPLNLET